MVTGENSERAEERVHLLREYMNNHQQNVGRNMDSKSHSDEVSDGHEEPLLVDNGDKAILSIKGRIIRLTYIHVLSSVLRKVKLVSYESGYLAEEVSKQS